MNNLLNQELGELLTEYTFSTRLKCESALRVAAATLFNTRGEITATTVVCDLQGGDLDGLESLVQEIADEFAFDAVIHLQQPTSPGSYSVRFTWPQPPVLAIEQLHVKKSMLARLLRR